MVKAKVIIILAAVLLLMPIASGCAKPIVLQDSFWLEPGDQPGEEIADGEKFLSELYGSGSSRYGWYFSKLCYLESGKPVEIVVRQRIPESGVRCFDGVLLRGESYSEAASEWGPIPRYWDLGAFREVGGYYERLLVFTPDAGYYCLCLINECDDANTTVWCEFTIRQ